MCFRAACRLLLLCALCSPAFLNRAVAGDTPVATPELASDPEFVLLQALDLERSHDWTGALRIYEQAVSSWPGRVEFRHRQRLCESHYRLGRRYHDTSFRDILLHMPPSQALELYDEVLERIDQNYVERVSFGPLLRRGLDNLEVALRDPAFLDVNAPNTDAKRVLDLRREYQARRDNPAVRSRAQARDFVSQMCSIGRAKLKVPATAVILEFIYGACDALDDYSCYLTPNKLEDLYAVIDGNFVGLGVELKQDAAGLLLVAVLPGGPAADAGLKAGELITHIDGTALAGQSLDEAASKLQGAEGSAVELTLRDKQSKSRTLRMTRRPVEVMSVSRAGIIDSAVGVGYVALSGFQKSSTQELQRAIASLQRQGMRYLVLDLRGNPGGLLDVAVELADEFLDSGVIVSTRGRAENQTAQYRAHPGTMWRLGMAVLVDHDSASASEILAGALKENRRAVVLGEQSYGKGSVQSIFPLRGAPAGLKLTTAKFYSPLDIAYSEHGVLPDIQVRVAARPPEGTAPPEFEPGDPTRDPVLERALAEARRSTARR